MSTALEDIHNEVSKQKKKINLLVHADTYTLEGEWKIATDGQHVSTIADLSGLALTFNYLIDINGTNYLVHPDDLVLIGEIMDDLGQSKKASCNLRIITAKGEVQLLEGAGTLVSINNTAIADWDDKTSRKELELRIFRHAEQVADIGAWTWNLGTDEFYCTENCYRILGLNADAGKINFSLVSQLIHFDDRERVLQHVFEMKRQKKDVEISFRILLPHGEVRYLRNKAEVFTTRKGVQYFIGTTQNITKEQLSGRRAESSGKEEPGHLQIETEQAILRLRQELAQVDKDKYLTIFSNMEQAFCIVELIFDDAGKCIDYRFLEVNPIFEKQTGLVDVVGKTMRELQPAHEEQWFRIFGEIVASGQAVHFEKEASQLKSGVWYDVFAFRHGPEGSNQVAILFNDITARKRVEEALHLRVVESGAALKEKSHCVNHIIEAIPDMISVIEIATGNVEYLNSKPFIEQGFSPDDMMHASSAERKKMVHPEDQQAVADYFLRFRELDERATNTVDYRARNAGGEWLWFRANGKVFRRNAEGIPTHCVNVIQNTTRYRQAQEELVNVKELLARKVQDKYRLLFESIDEGFCIIQVIFNENGVATDYRFVEANPAFEKLTSLKNVGGRTIRELVPAIEDQWIELFGGVARTGESVRFDQQTNALGDKWYEVYASPTGDQGSDLVAVLYTDITERRRAEQDLKELNSKLREMNKVQTTFFSNVSHEFRTPLTLLLSPLDDILRNNASKISPEERQKLQLVYRNAARLQKLVNTLRDFARIEAGKIEAFYQPTDLSQFTYELAGNFRAAVEKAGLRYVVKTPDIGESVYINREMWEKIVLNLISNAFKFTHKGKIEVELRSKKKHIDLHVRDTGIGISSNNLGRIFDRFVKIEVPGARTFEGSGIGLALVKELVSMHGGSIKVRSTEGVGSEFIVAIPKGKSHLPAKEIYESKEKLPSTVLSSSYAEEAMNWLPEVRTKRSSTLQPQLSSAKRKEKATQPMILVADDNADMRDYLAHILGDDYRVNVVENGRKLLDYVRLGNKPDLILADVMMPEVDGFKVVEHLKAMPDYMRIPIILLSARTSEESKIEGLRIGADDYLIKPFSARELLALVNSRITIASLRNSAQFELANRNVELEQRVHERTEELEESRQVVEKQSLQLQKVLDAIPQMVWVLNPAGKIRFVNDRWYSYTGMTADQCFDSEASRCDIFHISQKAEIAMKWETLRTTMERYVGEVLIKNEEGKYRWHLDITEPIFDQQGNLEMWVGTFTDVHEEFVKEREVRDMRDLLQAVFNASTNGIAVFDSVYDDQGQIHDFRWKYSNQEAQVFAEPHSLEGASLRDLFEPSKAESVVETLRRVVETGDTAEFDYQQRKSGTDVWYHIVAVKLEDGIVLTLRDITERVKIKQNLQNLNDALKEKNRELKVMNDELTNFAFIASHDLREPLRKIQLFAGQLKNRNVSNINEQGDLYADKIMNAVHRMNELIEDVLTYSRASVSARPEAVATDLNEVLHQVLADMSEAIRERGTLITHNNLPVFKCNALQISQLFQNLISNAIKFQPGDRQPRIEINCRIIPGETIDSPLANPDIEYLKLEVSDNGIGFEQQYAEKIFGMFQRLHARSTFPGTGMGLAICRKVTENHKGFITARGVPGEGATFTCYLPVQPD